MKLGIAIPAIREEEIGKFIDEWSFFKGKVYVMEDHQSKEFKLKRSVKHYTHKDVEKELKDSSWIIPQTSPACRSYAIYKVWKDGCDIIYLMDDDVHALNQNYFKIHQQNLESYAIGGGDYHNTLEEKSGIFPRGYPQNEKTKHPVYLSHGLWHENPDLNGIDSLKHPDYRIPNDIKTRSIRKNTMFPMCGMNVAFKRDLTPAMYMGLQGPSWGFDRYDDIWCGYMAKKYCDVKGWGVCTGNPCVIHTKASDPIANMEKEATGFGYNEEYWKNMLNHSPGGAILESFPSEYGRKLNEAYSKWFRLFDLNFDMEFM